MMTDWWSVIPYTVSYQNQFHKYQYYKSILISGEYVQILNIMIMNTMHELLIDLKANCLESCFTESGLGFKMAIQ